MYSYEWDIETGGYLLNTTPLAFSKEPRPVYYQELDVLGFDKYWNYEKDDTYPYMWAEANNYWYRGRKVAATRGGKLGCPPEIVLYEEPEIDNKPLKHVDIKSMVSKNINIMEPLVQDTIKTVYNTYRYYQNKIDVFYVAYSGGKDSAVTLDIVQRALPHNSFKVLFGDTGMEFPDTYKTVDKAEKFCQDENIEFIRAKSHFNPFESWKIFGPPATVTRWCCSVHKTAPQITTLRELLGKPNFTGMAFIGVRASESLSRSEYEYVSLGEKHKGQYSCNPILAWNTAELYLYIYMNELYINPAYKKGNKRAGCLVCPRAAERNEYMASIWYKDEFYKFIDIIKELYHNTIHENKINEFISNGGWKARKNGRDLNLNMGYSESASNGKMKITVKHPHTPWREWIKTIGVLLNDESPFVIEYKNNQYTFEVLENEHGYEVQFNETLSKQAPLLVKLLKEVFRKSACCVACRECEADCHNGYIHMENGKISISKECTHCSLCHKVEKGCLVYKSLEMPRGGISMLNNKSLNCYSHHAPKQDWFNQYFEYKNEFDANNTLGSVMKPFFKRFLRDAELLDNNGFTYTAEVVEKIGLENNIAWSIMLVNLVYTPQLGWFVRKINFLEEYKKEYVVNLLVMDGAKESWVNDVWSSLGRILELKFSEVGLGNIYREKNKIVSLERKPWYNADSKVVLYSLYKFAEACGDMHKFTLSRIMDTYVESDGVSPVQIFGLDEESLKNIINGLTLNYPDFITATFSLGLDNINLNSEKTSKDVLDLF